MAPIAGVFVVSTVAGLGATLGYRLARDVVVPAVGRAVADAESFWDMLTRDDGQACQPQDAPPTTDGGSI